MAFSTRDLLVVGIGLLLGALYLFKDSLFAKKDPFSDSSSASKSGSNEANGHGDSRDFVAKMKAGKKRIAIIFGSQTGTAEDYAIRLAKEAKSRFGLGCLVCDAEEYDYENLDQVPDDCAVFFVMATYGEGEPTDNAVGLYENLRSDEFEFSNGSHDLSGLKYVVFGLGNKTYEHYNVIAQHVDEALSKAGAKRIGERGEGDDDKSLEEDYLAWKDGMWAELSKAMGVEEGAGSDTADFAVSELSTVDQAKVFLGELSVRALNKTKGIHDVKNPYPAPLTTVKELFTLGSSSSDEERNCIHAEFDIDGSGISYQHGDHVGIWPSNASSHVDLLLKMLGLTEKASSVISIESLDPALAKVPFPVPTTYETALRHYLDISALCGRQAINVLSRYAPTESAAKIMTSLGSDRLAYTETVAKPCLNIGEVLQLAAKVSPEGSEEITWSIPFDVIVGNVPRLQPRYYSISSSPKLHPKSIHVTCVVLKFKNEPHASGKEKWVYGVGSNFLLNLKAASHGEEPASKEAAGQMGMATNPKYEITGPRQAYYDTENKLYKAPIHVRRSPFRMPTNSKTPVIMIGPGTGVAPFRGFVQEKVSLAKKALDKNGPEALANWGQLTLYYGCRSESQDFLYASEWPEYAESLKGKFVMRTAFSRSGPRKPDGSKIYVQDLIWDDRESLGKMVWDQKAYVYVCGEAKSMSKAVEEVLARVLALAMGKEGDVEAGAKEVKKMKERSRMLLDVWS